MKFRRIVTALSAAALTLCLSTAASGAVSFTDTVDHPAESVIRQFATLKILEGDGYGHFFPDLSISRGDMCTILDRVFIYTDRAPNTFTDLNEKKWYAEPMLKLNALGIVQGDGNLIRPLDTIRWDEALVMIARAFGLEEDFDLALPVEVGRWARGYLAAMWKAGYFSMEDFDPAAPFSRADTVITLNNVVSDLGWTVTGKIKIANKLVPIQESVPVYQYDTESFYEKDGRYYYDDGVTPVAYGIDVSAYQKEIDWQAVAADGIDFALIRVGYRGWGEAGRLVIDEYFEANMQGAREAGLDLGVYFFSQAVTPQEAEEEARLVLECLDGQPLTYPVIFDWETISGVNGRANKLDTETLHACARAFNSVISAAGYQPMAYFSQSLGLLKYDLSRLTDYPFWLAYYASEPDPNFYYNFRMWQYSSTGKVAGIEGNVDMNICFYPFGRVHEDRPDETATDPFGGPLRNASQETGSDAVLP